MYRWRGPGVQPTTRIFYLKKSPTSDSPRTVDRAGLFCGCTVIGPASADENTRVAGHRRWAGMLRSAAKKARSSIGGYMKKIRQKIAALALAVPVLLGATALPSHADSPTPAPGSSFNAPAIITATAAQRTKIAVAIKAVRAKNTWLGATTGAVKYDNFKGGGSQGYRGGLVVWNPTVSKAFALKPAFFDLYVKWGSERGWLGYPTSAESGGLKGGGKVQHFTRGDAYWSPTTGAHQVLDPFTWVKHGGLNGRLGYPTSDSMNGTNTMYQKYQGGRIYLDHTVVYIK